MIAAAKSELIESPGRRHAQPTMTTVIMIVARTAEAGQPVSPA